jgi:outer membrane protein
MKQKLMTATMALLVFQFSRAQETRTLTLKEAVDLSIKNNKMLKADSARILQAIYQTKQAEEKKLPEASVSGSYLYLPFQPNVRLKTGSGSGGGPSIHQAVYGIANISYPVYDGGKNKYGIESATYLEQAIRLDADNDKESEMMNTISACINLYKAYQAIELVKQSLEEANQRVKDFSNLEKNGLLARNDLLKAELQASNVELSLLDVQGNYKLACVNMNLLMGLPEQTVLVPDKSGLGLPASVKTIDEYETDAIRNRKDLDAIAIRKKMAEANYKSLRTDKYPTISISGGYIAADVPKFLSIYNAMNIGIGIHYNISSLWKNKSKLGEAQARINEVQANADLLDQHIRLKVNQAYENYLVTKKKTEVLTQSVDQAAEKALLQARLSVTNAQADLFLAYHKILQTAGILNY